MKRPVPQSTIERYVVRSLGSLFETVAFWTAITLPFLYVPFLAVGLDTQSETVAFFGLLCVHLLALTVGAGHRSG